MPPWHTAIGLASVRNRIFAVHGGLLGKLISIALRPRNPVGRGMGINIHYGSVRCGLDPLKNTGAHALFMSYSTFNSIHLFWVVHTQNSLSSGLSPGLARRVYVLERTALPSCIAPICAHSSDATLEENWFSARLSLIRPTLTHYS